jgi:cysteinyl-tRNA synthetase
MAKQSESDFSAEAISLLQERVAARAARDFSRSDELRDQLASMGIEVRDTSEGQTWSLISRAE